MPRQNSGSGAATAAGITFQENVAAWLVCQILAGPNRTNDLELPSDALLETITCESLQPIDDIVVGATARTLYFQCKTTLDVGTSSDFIKVVRQFVEQFLKPGHPDDRYVLAVSDTASALLRNSLHRALRLVRGKRGDERTQELANRDQVTRQKYQIIEQTVREQLLLLKKGPRVSDEDVYSLIDRVMIYAAPFGAGACTPDAATDKLALVLTRPEDANRAWEHIVSVVRGFSPHRTGGNRERLVRDLRDEGLIAKPREKVREAIVSLQASSRDYLAKLARHTLIQYGSEPLGEEINRPIVAQIYRELQSGNLLLCGEAGVGKTGCLVQVARRLQQDDVPVLVLPIERVFRGSDSHPSLALLTGVLLDEVLSGWPTDQPGVVCLDGLDAARSSVSLRTVLDFVYQVRTAAPDWKVLASIREYDLQKSDEIRRLFPGTVSAAVPSSEIAGVRAVRIPELTDGEIGQLYDKVPHLEEALAYQEAVSLRSLARNIFNLDLLVDLLTFSVVQHELRRVDTQDKLLEIYWRKRVDEVANSEGPANSTEALTALTRGMIDGRQVAVHVQPQLAGELTGFFSNSVLTREPGLLSEDPELIRYRHNILFDYAVSRLWLKGLNDQAVLAEVARSPDLALVFRPSLRMTLLRLWRADPTRKSFWSRVTAWFGSEEMNDICRLSVTQVAAEEFREVRDMAPLLDQLDDSASAALLQESIAAALLLLRVDREAFDIVGPDAAAWLALIQRLAEHGTFRFPYLLRNVLAAVLDGSPNGRDKLTDEQRSSFAFIASRLLDVYIADASDYVVRREVLGVAVRACIFSISWDSGEPIAALQRALAPDFLAKAGFVVLPLLGDEITSLADIDESFVEQVFAAYENLPEPASDHLTSMGSGAILSLTSTAAQDLSMFEYSVGKVFKELVASHPELAARVMRLILRHHWMRRELDRTETVSDRTTAFEFEGKQRIYIRDYSYIWDSGQRSTKRNLWCNAANAVFTILKMQTTTSLVRDALFDVLLAEADIGAIWNRLLLAATELAESFGQRLAPLLTHSVFLREFETRHAVGKLLEYRFETWGEDVRERVEAAIMQVGREVYDFRDESKEAAERLRDSLVVCLPLSAIVSEDVRRVADHVRSEQSASPPSVRFQMGECGFISEEDHLREKGQLETEAQRRYFELREEVKRLSRSNGSLTVDDLPHALDTISAYEAALASAKTDVISGEQTEYAEGEIAEVFSILASVEGLKEADRDVILQRLLTFTTHAEPTLTEERDACWDGESPHWGSPFPRIEAAWGLMRFLRRGKEIDDRTRTAILQLACDAVPAVRYPIIQKLRSLYEIDQDTFWKVLEDRVEKEERLALLVSTIRVLIGFPPNNEHAGSVDRLIHQIETRVADREDAGFVRKEMVVHHLHRMIYLGDKNAECCLEAVLESPFDRCEELYELLRLWGELLSNPLSTEVFTVDELTSRGIDILVRMFDASHAAFRERPWEGLEGDEGRSAYHRAAGPMQWVIDTTSLLLDRRTHPNEPAPRSDHERISRIVHIFRPLIEKCATVPLPSEAYEFLQTLQYISPVVPGDALQWVRTVVRSATEHRFLSDYMGADRLIDLLERYLVEHRDLLCNSAAARSAMIDLLNDCVRNGWPKAAPLLMRLHEVFRA